MTTASTTWSATLHQKHASHTSGSHPSLDHPCHLAVADPRAAGVREHEHHRFLALVMGVIERRDGHRLLSLARRKGARPVRLRVVRSRDGPCRRPSRSPRSRSPARARQAHHEVVRHGRAFRHPVSLRRTYGPQPRWPKALWTPRPPSVARPISRPRRTTARHSATPRPPLRVCPNPQVRIGLAVPKRPDRAEYPVLPDR